MTPGTSRALASLPVTGRRRNDETIEWLSQTSLLTPYAARAPPRRRPWVFSRREPVSSALAGPPRTPPSAAYSAVAQESP